ncbi:ATP-binding cassette domain-containing protein [Fructobacillus sp. M1-13]|uniref:ATP-binding cassette domain-containing protein n=1 Tax=Fructobacillus papyriferae TaxID=2713171 RepID=A0ABS5QQ87_9LACO|nr:ATP-binding cassette domain-containing protein [Fructobacillus papyriferae]MBS9335350.1 ATP-binding cassette domain-containing protein [Fructobacillus papyriferae]MCD2158981.1 ATP-binding cassette domain-containing protein [Fructobacillus papyriferae]
MTAPIISLQNIDVTFTPKGKTIHAVKDVSIDVQKGDIYGIVGYSGAGKSTLVRTVNLLQEPTKGSVIINGETFFSKVDGQAKTQIKGNELKEKRRKIGMIFQHFNLLNERTVEENVLFALENSKDKEADKKKKVEGLLDLVDLSDRAKQYPSQLSGGQKQRVAIARALANDPEILISDEATSALDPKTTRQILALLKKLNQEYNLTVLLITHEMEAVKSIANKVAVMQNGRVLEKGSTLDIFTKPQAELTKEFIATATNQDQAIEAISQSEAVEDLTDGQIFAQLTYSGNATNEPLITSLYQNFGIVANILYGNVEVLQDTEVGSLLVILSGDTTNMDAALDFLAAQSVSVNILKGEQA